MTDLAWAVGLFTACWLVFAILYLSTAGAGLVSDAGSALVVLAFLAAAVVLALSLVFLSDHFTSQGAHLVVSVGAPFAFLGFAGLFMLLVPVSVQRSVSLTMLVALERGDSLPDHRVFDFRWRQMEAGGLVTSDTTGRHLTRSGRQIIRVALFLGRLLNVRPQ
jgi:hypothetical protein